ncbi:response regulator [Brevibacillus humidisoli]|uniref:response regulator n=1 Tax=Brevibacillus humidisoli TaxID=2895522 RepID=UPI001E2BA5A1|nr:response regulator [Brevibacillus humidisoli]UFJ39027.1 response regulator [Brevibacillus humidisoli]
MTTFFVMDDDLAARRMLSTLIEDNDLGTVVGEAEDGNGAETQVLRHHPDVLVIDLLMPEQDGIETIRRLKELGYQGKLVMLSQVEHKEMISEAYQNGVEYYIQKPINRIEVVAVLRKVIERIQLEASIRQIRKSLAWIEQDTPTRQQKTALSITDLVRAALTDLGIVGEAGTRDLTRIVDYLVSNEHKLDEHHLPPLRELYAAVLQPGLSTEASEKEIKAIEQRVRRAVAQALLNVASMGLTDYTNPIFEQYATRYFDFADVRQKMREIETDEEQSRVRLNLKKFLYALYLDVVQQWTDQVDTF